MNGDNNPTCPWLDSTIRCLLFFLRQDGVIPCYCLGFLTPLPMRLMITSSILTWLQRFVTILVIDFLNVMPSRFINYQFLARLVIYGAYYNHLKAFWDKLSTYTLVLTCSCGGMKLYIDMQRQERLMQFLTNLNVLCSHSQPNFLYGLFALS